MLSSARVFNENSLIVACFYFSQLEIKTLTTNRFKNQTNDIFKLLGPNWNHQQGFLQQKVVALHRCGLNSKLPKHFSFDRYFG